MATIGDIAKHCHVSVATVSYVLNGQGEERRISEATQERVRRCAAELGYRSRRQPGLKLKTAIYWMHRQLEMAMPQAINGINSAIQSGNEPVDFVIRPYELGHLEDKRELWEEPDFDVAVIIAPNQKDMLYLAEHKVISPCVLINRELEGYYSVTTDHEEIGRLAAEHALSKQCSDVAFVQNPYNLYGLNRRAAAVIETFRKAGVDIQNNILFCSNTIDDGYELGRGMVLNNRLHKIIICSYDMAALGIMSAFNEAGISIGKDVQVISASSSPQSLLARAYTPLTVVDMKFDEICEKGIKLAVDVAAKRVTVPTRLVVHPQMIYRQSCPLNNW